MNDPIKDFVEKHREEFDHLEAPVFDIKRFKSGLNPIEQPKKRYILKFSKSQLLVAASVVLAFTCAWLFFRTENSSTIELEYQSRIDEKLTEVPKADTTNNSVAEKMIDKSDAEKRPVLAENTRPASKPSNRPSSLYSGLTDSTSASSRLLAILEIEKSGNSDNKLMSMVAKTLNHDPNTNVRLAALSLLDKHRNKEHVSALLINSLNNQDDPMVQLGLVSLLGKMKNIKIDDKLQALASNPDTFDAVRDEAYNILLNQDKL